MIFAEIIIVLGSLQKCYSIWVMSIIEIIVMDANTYRCDDLDDYLNRNIILVRIFIK